MGYGYPTLAAAKLSFRFPGEFNFINRSVGGDRSTSLYARCSKEMVECNPDYMSILIGVNDVWHGLYNGTGIHSTYAGHELIASELLKGLNL